MIRDFIGSGFLAPYLPPLPADLDFCQRWHFASLADFAAAVPRSPTPHAWQPYCWQPDYSNKRGTNSMGDALALARGGWQEGAERVQAICDRIALAQPQRPRIARWDVAGSVASIPRHLAGSPLAMRRMVTSETSRRPVLTLLAFLSAPFGEDGEAFIQSAAIAAAMVDRLETAGFRCEVIGASRNHDQMKHRAPPHECRRQQEFAFIAKRAEDPVDLATLAFALGHPSVSRRMQFALYQTGNPVRRDGQGIGAAVDYVTHPERPAATFCLPMPGTYRGSDADAFEQACAILRDQGCPGIPDALAA